MKLLLELLPLRQCQSRLRHPADSPGLLKVDKVGAQKQSLTRASNHPYMHQSDHPSSSSSQPLACLMLSIRSQLDTYRRKARRGKGKLAFVDRPRLPAGGEGWGRGGWAAYSSKSDAISSVPQASLSSVSPCYLMSASRPSSFSMTERDRQPCMYNHKEGWFR